MRISDWSSDVCSSDLKMSLRASTTGMIALTDCAIAEDAILPDAKGLRGPFSCLNKARYGIAWGSMGAAESCWEASRAYALGRTILDRKSVVSGKSVSVRVAHGGRGILKKKKTN